MSDIRQPRTPTHGTEDEIGALIRFADAPAKVSSERASRARSTLHTQWRRQVRQRRLRGALWATGSLAAAVVAVAFGLSIWGGAESTIPEIPLGRVTAVSGPAWARPGGTDSDAAVVRPGQIVPAELEVFTGEGRVALLLEGDLAVRLDRNTRVRFLGQRSLALEEGKLYVDSGSGHNDGAAIEIRVGNRRIRDIGTQFEVQARDGTVRVRVREGRVVVDAAEQSHQVAAGTELELSPDDELRRRKVTPYGTLWSWTTTVVPMLRLEGRSARAFLDWISREHGWRLEFADDEVRRSASRIVLSGSGDGLTLENALDAVLPTCRMAYEVEDGTLRIRSLAAEGT